MYSKYVVAGHVGKNIRKTTTLNGTSKATFDIAEKRKRGGEESTVWHTITAFGNKADYVAAWVRPGDAVIVEGTLYATPEGGPPCWMGQDGKAHSKFSVSASIVVITKYKEGYEDRGEVPGGTSDPSTEYLEDFGPEEDLPF